MWEATEVGSGPQEGMETGAHALHMWEGEIPMALPSLDVPNVNHTLKELLCIFI